MRRVVWVAAWAAWIAGSLLVARVGWIWATTPAPPGPLTAWDWVIRGVGAMLFWVGVAMVWVPWRKER